MSAPDQSKNDRPLPHDFAAERTLLAAILVDNDHYGRISKIVQPRDFFSPQSQTIFRRMGIMIEANSPIDLVTLVDELNANGELDQVGGAPLVSSLTDGIPRILNVGAYASIVLKKSQLRQIATCGYGLEEKAF